MRPALDCRGSPPSSPSGTLRRVFDHDPLCGQSITYEVGFLEVALPFESVALLDEAVNLRIVAPRRGTGAEPGRGGLAEQAEQPGAGAQRLRERAFFERFRGAVGRAHDAEQLCYGLGRVEVVLERRENAVRWRRSRRARQLAADSGIAQRAIHAVELLLRLADELLRPIERLAVVRRQQREPHRL